MDKPQSNISVTRKPGILRNFCTYKGGLVAETLGNCSCTAFKSILILPESWHFSYMQKRPEKYAAALNAQKEHTTYLYRGIVEAELASALAWCTAHGRMSTEQGTQKASRRQVAAGDNMPPSQPMV